MPGNGYQAPTPARWFLAALLATSLACGITKAGVTYLQPVKEGRVSVLSRGQVSVAGYAQRNSLISIALRSSKDSDTQEAIYGVGITASNESSLPIKFGPEDVFLADSGLRLFPRVSEAWIEKHYEESLGRLDRSAIASAYLGSTSFYVAGATFLIPPVAIGSAATGLLFSVLSAGHFAATSELKRTRQEILEDLLRPLVLLPKTEVVASVYFYNSPTLKPRFPLKVIVKLGGDLYLIHFNSPSLDR